MFYVIICYAPVAIVIQCFIDAFDLVFLLIINRVTTDNLMSQLLHFFGQITVFKAVPQLCGHHHQFSYTLL